MKPWSALGAVAVLALLPLVVLLAVQQAAYRRAERIGDFSRQLMLVEYFHEATSDAYWALRDFLHSGDELDFEQFLGAQRSVEEHEGALMERLDDAEGRRLLTAIHVHRLDARARVERLLDSRHDLPRAELASAVRALVEPAFAEHQRRVDALTDSRRTNLHQAQEELARFQSRGRLLALLSGLAAAAIVLTASRRASESRKRELASMDAVRRSEEELKLLAETIPHLVWVSRGDGGPVYVNGRWSRFGEIASEGVFVESLLAAVHEDDREPLLQAWQRALETSEPFEAEFRLRERATGHYRWQLTRAVPVRGPDGRVDKWFGTSTDIDETRRTQLALERSQAQLQMLWETNVVGVCRWEERERIVEANDALLAMLGRTRSEVATGEITWGLLTPPGWEAVDAVAFQRLADRGAVAPYEKEYQRPDGARVPVLMCGVSDDQGASGLALIVDIGARKRIEELQTQIVGVVSHDLRSPLSALTVSLGSLRRALADDPRRASVLDRALRSAARMERIIRDLLDYTRTRTGRLLTIEPRAGSLRAMLTELAGELRQAHDRSLDVETSGDDEVTWDLDRIAQAVQNLVSNAFKHGAPGAPVRIRVHGDEERVRIDVENEGPALPEDLLQGAFEPFRSSRAGERTVRTSYGLGLYIVRQIASAHGGRLEARSPTPGRAVFTLDLPRHVTAQGEAS